MKNNVSNCFNTELKFKLQTKTLENLNLFKTFFLITDSGFTFLKFSHLSEEKQRLSATSFKTASQRLYHEAAPSS